jgi:hypothetical protein
MSVNGFDDSKNRKEVYTKDETRTLLNEVKTKVITSSYTTDTGDNKIEVTVRRSGNIVTVRTEVLMQPEEVGNYVSFNLENLPDWATPKRIYNPDKITNKVIARCVTSPIIGTNGTPEGTKQDANIWFNSSKGICVLMGTFHNYSLSEAQTNVATLTYIVDDELPEGNYQLGDINGDGVINQDDLDLLSNYILGYEGLSEKQKVLADINKDGILNTADTLKLSQYINGYIDSLE